MVVPVDKTGVPITVGCWIVYGHAMGRCAGLRIGKVLGIKDREPKWNGETRVYVRVIGVDDDWGGRKATLCSREGLLEYPDRMLVLDAARVPPYAVELVTEYEVRKSKQ